MADIVGRMVRLRHSIVRNGRIVHRLGKRFRVTGVYRGRPTITALGRNVNDRGQTLEVYASDIELCCRECGCTQRDCSGCVERTGVPCEWVELDLCSACVDSKSLVGGSTK